MSHITDGSEPDFFTSPGPGSAHAGALDEYRNSAYTQSPDRDAALKQGNGSVAALDQRKGSGFYDDYLYDYQPARWFPDTSDRSPEAQTTRPEKARTIEWSPDLYGAYKEAIETNKPLMVEFSAPWCGHCVRLNDGPLKSTEMQAFANRAVFTRVDPDQDDDQKNISTMANSLGIDRYPTIVLLNPNNGSLREVGRIIGYHETPKLVEQMNILFNRYDEQERLDNGRIMTA